MKKIRVLAVLLSSLFIVGCASTLKEPPKELQSSAFWVQQSDVPVEHKNLKIIKRGSPFFPASALNDNQQGWCIAQYDIADNGSTQNIKILECSPAGYFAYGCEKMVGEYQYAKQGLPAKGVISSCVFRMQN